jgi:hypothetical protein
VSLLDGNLQSAASMLKYVSDNLPCNLYNQTYSSPYILNADSGYDVFLRTVGIHLQHDTVPQPRMAQLGYSNLKWLFLKHAFGTGYIIVFIS